MERSKGLKFFGGAVIALGVYSLIGVGSYKQFAFMFKPIFPPVILTIYLFTILYGICSIYCGSKILKLEDWARKLIVVLTTISVISGLFLQRTVMSNLREFLLSQESPLSPELINSVYTYTIVFTALITFFELSLIYFFTRPGVIQQFETNK